MKHFFVILNILVGALLISYFFHEAFLTGMDKIFMPFTEEFCNSQPNTLGNGKVTVARQ